MIQKRLYQALNTFLIVLITGIGVGSLSMMSQKAFAADPTIPCADGTLVAAPPTNLGAEDKKAVIQSECEAHGGTKQDFAAGCKPRGSFFGMPTWFKYLNGDSVTDEGTGITSCSVRLNGLSDIWKIVAAVVELLLRFASLISIGFVVFGGILYTVSQGQPDKTKQALRTIINALIGLAIAIVATAIVSFIAGRF